MRRALFAIAILLIASCKAKSPTEPPLHTGSGKLVVTVVDSTRHVGVGNVSVQIDRDTGTLSTTGLTNAAGVLETSLPAGVYRVKVAFPADYPIRSISPSASDLQITEGMTTAINVTAIGI